MRILFLLLALAYGLLGQTLPTTATFTAQTNTVTTGVTVVPPAYNIGQFFHELIITPSDVTAGTCASGWAGLIRLEGSFDGTAWLQLGIPLTTAPNNAPLIAFAQGSLPFTRVNYISGNTSQCRLTIQYVGSLVGITPTFVLNTFTADTSVNTEVQLAACSGSNVSIYNLSLVNDAAANGFIFRIKVG